MSEGYIRDFAAGHAAESTSARLARVEAERDQACGLSVELLRENAELQQSLADADQDRADLRDALAQRAEALLLAEAENAKLRARLKRAQAQCALPNPPENRG